MKLEAGRQAQIRLSARDKWSNYGGAWQ